MIDFTIVTTKSLSNALNIHSFSFFLVYFQIVLFGVEQIFNSFIVNFTHWYTHCKFHIFISSINPIENCTNHSWNNTLVLNIIHIWTHHCMCFTRRCLAISKNSTIKTLQYRVNNWSSWYIVYIFLNWLSIKNMIKFKLVLSKWAAWVWQINSNILIILIKV